MPTDLPPRRRPRPDEDLPWIAYYVVGLALIALTIAIVVGIFL
jgi:hypothetical protein